MMRFFDWLRRHPTRAELIAENDRLLNMLADPEVLRVEINKGEVNIGMRPPDWAVKALTYSLAQTIGDAPNYVVLGIGTHDIGFFEVTIKRYHGKSPTQINEEKLAAYQQVVKKQDQLIIAMMKAGANVPNEPLLTDSDKEIIQFLE